MRGSDIGLHVPSSRQLGSPPTHLPSGNSNLGEGASSWAPGILFSESLSLFYTESLSPGILPTPLSGLWPSVIRSLSPSFWISVPLSSWSLSFPHVLSLSLLLQSLLTPNSFSLIICSVTLDQPPKPP